MDKHDGRVFVFTGAGVSAESGLATFRGADGLWEGHDLNVVCNESTWRNHRGAVVSFYNELRTKLASVAPNDAHRAIARWQRIFGATLMTQNVDDLHARSGSEEVVHLHGRLTRMRCIACGETWDVGHEAWPEDRRCAGGRKRCDSLRGVRPDVVFYGGTAPKYARLHSAIRSLRAQDTVVVMGTSCTTIPFHEMLARTPATRVLNLLEASEAVARGFHAVFLGLAAHEAARLEEDLSARHGPVI
jgi:NAD-dependent deacetylase